MKLSSSFSLGPAEVPLEQLQEAQQWLTTVTKAFENKDADFVKNYFEDSDSAYLETEGGNVVYKGTAALTESYKWWFSGFGKVQYVLNSVNVDVAANQVKYAVLATWTPLPQAKGLEAILNEEGLLILPMEFVLTRVGNTQKMTSMEIIGDLAKLAALCKAGITG